jgi:hypothetical protein
MTRSNRVLRLASLGLAGGLCLSVLPATPAFGQQDEKQQESTKPAKEPTDFRKLREWLPAELGGLKRADASGQRFGTGEDRISMATGNYNDENHEKTINLVVTDFSAQDDPGSAAFWKDQEMDNETDTGYSKTSKIEGYPAFESFDSNGNSGSVMVLVEDRVMVTLYTSGLDKAAFEKVRDGMGLKKLGEVVKGGGATTRPAGEAGEQGGE